MTAYATILVDTGAVARITLNRPDKRNPIGPATCGELVHAFAALRDDPAVRVIVLTGAGAAFSAGGDFGMIEKMLDDAKVRARIWKEARDLVYNVINCSKPIVSAINGAAVVNNIVGGSYVATDAITFDAAALIAGASFDSGADVTLAAAGVIELVNVKANDNATLTSGADINAATVIANHGEASLTAAGFIANTAVEAGDAATLLAGADVSGSSVTAMRDAASASAAISAATYK